MDICFIVSMFVEPETPQSTFIQAYVNVQPVLTAPGGGGSRSLRSTQRISLKSGPRLMDIRFIASMFVEPETPQSNFHTSICQRSACINRPGEVEQPLIEVNCLKILKSNEVMER